jgi:hypothetical protein
MSKNQSAANLTSGTNSRVGRQYTPEQRVVLFGNAGDEEVRRSAEQLKKQGREFGLKPRPDFDTGLGKCGKHLCHCKEHCQQQFEGRE